MRVLLIVALVLAVGACTGPKCKEVSIQSDAGAREFLAGEMTTRETLKMMQTGKVTVCEVRHSK